MCQRRWRSLYRLANEKQLPDMQREPGWKRESMTRLKASMERIGK